MAYGAAIAAVVVAVAGIAYSANQNEKAAEARDRAAKLERRSAQLKNVESRRRAVREAIVKQSQVISRAEAQGATSLSSGTQVSIGGVQTQLGSNLALQDTLNNFNTRALSNLDRAAKFDLRAREGQQYSQALSSSFLAAA